MWREHSHGRIDLGDQQLEYRWIRPNRAGRPSLIFLHEGLGCVGIWKSFPDRVAEATGCGAFIYSRRGYGKSSPVPLPRSLRYMHDEGLEVLPRLLTQLDLGPVVLIGHSDGASISLIHAGGTPSPDLAGLVALAPHVMNEDCCVASIRSLISVSQTSPCAPACCPCTTIMWIAPFGDGTAPGSIPISCAGIWKTICPASGFRSW